MSPSCSGTTRCTAPSASRSTAYEAAGGGPGAVRVAVWQAAFPLEMDDVPGADDAGTGTGTGTDGPEGNGGPDTGRDRP